MVKVVCCSEDDDDDVDVFGEMLLRTLRVSATMDGRRVCPNAAAADKTSDVEQEDIFTFFFFPVRSQ